MGDLIDKDALVAEIENRIKKYTLLQQTPEMSDLQEELQNKIDCLNSIKGYIINTLEVKDVNLEEEISFQWSKFCLSDKDKDSFIKVAKHFFELGLSVNNKVQKGE